jgi:plastocyanin
MRLVLPFVAVVAVLAAAGCGGSEKKSETGDANEVKVSMKNIKYVPKNVQVRVGQKITWVNEDPVSHTVTAKQGADFDSGTVNSGGTFSFTPEKAGTIAYVCIIHPDQTGTITVSGG